MALGPAEIAHGPMFIGFVFNCILYGIMITQCYLYYVTSKSDRLWIKIYVVVLFVADTVNTVFDIIYLYDALIIHFNDPPFLNNANWVFATGPALTAIIAALVQSFFAWRVKALTGSILAGSVIMVFALMGLFCGLGTAIGVGYVKHFVDLIKIKVVGIPWLVANCVGDVLITSILVWHLAGLKSGIAATDSTINRIIKVTVETGMVTSICVVVDLITFLLIPTGIHLIFNTPLPKLYTNSLMSSLNSRATWKSSHDTTPRSFVPVLDSRTSRMKMQPSYRPKVHVHVESHEMSDWADSKGGADMDMKAVNGVQPSIVNFGSASKSSSEKRGGEAV